MMNDGNPRKTFALNSLKSMSKNQSDISLSDTLRISRRGCESLKYVSSLDYSLSSSPTPLYTRAKKPASSNAAYFHSKDVRSASVELKPRSDQSRSDMFQNNAHFNTDLNTDCDSSDEYDSCSMRGVQNEPNKEIKTCSSNDKNDTHIGINYGKSHCRDFRRRMSFQASVDNPIDFDGNFLPFMPPLKPQCSPADSPSLHEPQPMFKSSAEIGDVSVNVDHANNPVRPSCIRENQHNWYRSAIELRHRGSEPIHWAGSIIRPMGQVSKMIRHFQSVLSSSDSLKKCARNRRHGFAQAQNSIDCRPIESHHSSATRKLSLPNYYLAVTPNNGCPSVVITDTSDDIADSWPVSGTETIEAQHKWWKSKDNVTVRRKSIGNSIRRCRDSLCETLMACGGAQSSTSHDRNRSMSCDASPSSSKHQRLEIGCWTMATAISLFFIVSALSQVLVF